MPQCGPRWAIDPGTASAALRLAAGPALTLPLGRTANPAYRKRIKTDRLLRDNIRSRDFYLNGCWVPLYSWHKLMGGLLEGERHCADKRAIEIAQRLGGYIATVFNALDDAQLQKMLDCEHGGLSESFAELYSPARLAGVLCRQRGQLLGTRFVAKRHGKFVVLHG
jgi:hypothetical protein